MGGLSWQLLRETQTAAIANAPPRAAPSPLPPPPPSSIALPVRVPLALLEAAVNDAVPQQLWQVDKPGSVCLKASRVRMFGAKLKLTPDVKCRIVGDVTRGPIRLSSRDDKLHLAMPVAATLEARDIGGLSMGKGTEAKALITADLVPELTREGRLTARIQLRYDWRQEPTVSILGQQIRLTEKADEKLAPILAKMEAELPRLWPRRCRPPARRVARRACCCTVLCWPIRSHCNARSTRRWPRWRRAVCWCRNGAG